MSNIFDNLQAKAHSLVNQVMGYDCTWGEHVARVLFNDPSKKYQLAGLDFEPAGWSMEYKEGDLPGLYERSQQGEIDEVTIGTTDYWVRSVRKEFDGKSYTAQLELKP
jgi:hypothetical protein